jgi:acetyl esterase/lipase
MRTLKYWLAAMSTVFSTQIFGQMPVEMPLYAGAIPNSKPAENLEKTEINQWGVSFTTATSVPTLTHYASPNPNGIAVVICPGGGYFGTAGDHEGKQVAEALNAAGVTVFVLKYRVPSDRYCVDKCLAPLQDAQQAIRTVRKNATTWGLNPSRIGILGFSAGGHLAATAATHFRTSADASARDTTSVRPDFVALIYAVVSLSDSLGHLGSRTALLGESPDAGRIYLFSNELQVTPDAPPAFLVHASDDDAVPVGNSIAYYQACLRHGVPAEMHLYAGGGHGFGLRNPTTHDLWMERLLNWLR